MIEAFDKYVNDYNMNDNNIKLKYNHSYRVMNLSKKYAEKLGFSEHDIKLATVIGLLHDIGRFHQAEKYHTFDDSKSIDHADYGVKELFDNNIIKLFWQDEDDYDIINFAIKNHNKFKIEDTAEERALMHAKLIRDTDKIDIIYLMGYLNETNIKASDEDISEEIIDSINNYKIINRNKRKNVNDKIANCFSFAFDVNYDICLEELKINLGYLYDRINSPKFKNIYDIINEYIDERIDKNVRN